MDAETGRSRYWEPVWLGIAAALVLWTVMFGPWGGNFWVLMTASTLTLGVFALVMERGLLHTKLPVRKAIVYGILSAAALYGIFYLGDRITAFLPFQNPQVSAVYDTRAQGPDWVIATLLIAVIGPGEELFWRGLIQRRMAGRWGAAAGIIVASLCYALVHIASLNPMLILAALVCGVFWGMLFQMTGSILPGIISHALWDAVIFVIAPLR